MSILISAEAVIVSSVSFPGFEKVQVMTIFKPTKSTAKALEAEWAKETKGYQAYPIFDGPKGKKVRFSESRTRQMIGYQGPDRLNVINLTLR